jgi:phosphoglycolate phosphatase
MKTNHPTVLLFDIDGTLVLTGGAGKRAMVGAFQKLHEREDVFDGVSFAGMTDRAIARHGLFRAKTHEELVTEHEIDRALEAYLALLESELASTAISPTGYRILPGVTALLDALAPHTGHIAIGLGTGNIKRGAYAKLSRGGLHSHFTFGGFGCDAEDRSALLEAGAKRGAEKLGVSRAEVRVVIIGDTPKDVSAAKGIGAPCIAVETGGYTASDLASCGAHRVFATLEDPAVLSALID